MPVLSLSSAPAAARGVRPPQGHVLGDENYNAKGGYGGFSSPLTPWCSKRAQLTENKLRDLNKGKLHELNH